MSVNGVYQQVTFGREAHDGLLRGAEILYRAVKATMGPSGHNVILDSDTAAPLITKDGVTVARAIRLREKLPGLGASLLKEVASKTNELAGDGTTTATVLGYSLLQQGVKMVATGRSAIGVKRGMDKALTEVTTWLHENAVEIRNRDDIVNVGTISANGDRIIGELLAEAIGKVGQDGIITIEPAKSVSTTLEVVEGMQFDSGYVSPFFVSNQEKLTCELQDAYVLITNKKITQLSDMLPVLELVANTNKPLLIIGDEIDGEVLHTLIVNKMKGVLFSCAVKAPSYSENRADILHDVALVTGGTVIDASSPLSLQNVKLEHLGQCKKVICGRHTTTLVGNGDEGTLALVAERTVQLRTALNAPMDDLRRNNTKKRLAKLAGGIAVIKVGGSTEVEIFEKKDRVEDALNATVAAVQEGILPGGGVALFYASEALLGVIKSNREGLTEDELAGMSVVFEACRLPLRVIVENTGKSADVVMEKLSHKHSQLFETEPGPGMDLRWGYDAYRHEYCDMLDRGIIDPLKVERYSLSHAVSVIGLVLTSNAVVMNEGDVEQ